MTETVYIEDLVLESTRQCNLKCPHCLRGDAEEVFMTPHVLDILAEQIHGGQVGTLTISGGEPTLYGSQFIPYVIQAFTTHEVDVCNFYIVVNGTRPSPPKDTLFVRALMDLYLFCSENETSTLDISNSKWHNLHQDNEFIRMLEVLKFTHHRHPLKSVIPEGRGKNLRDEQRHHWTPNEEITVEEYDKVCYVHGMLYMNAFGHIFTDCDLSYETQAKAAREKSNLYVCNVTSLRKTLFSRLHG